MNKRIQNKTSKSKLKCKVVLGRRDLKRENKVTTIRMNKMKIKKVFSILMRFILFSSLNFAS